MSQKSPRSRSEAKSQNGSIAEEIEEDLDDLSIEGDDLLRSEKSAVSRHTLLSQNKCNLLGRTVIGTVQTILHKYAVFSGFSLFAVKLHSDVLEIFENEFKVHSIFSFIAIVCTT